MIGVAIKECGTCGEVMPLTEKLCYCGGPIRINRYSSVGEMKFDPRDYYMRRMMFKLRKSDGKTVD